MFTVASTFNQSCRAPIASLECMEDLQHASNNEQMACNKDFLQIPRPVSRQSNQLINSGLKYRNLGKSGLRASNLGLGTWTTFGAQLTEEQMEDILNFAYDSGINVFDTSEIYSGGKAEAMLGKLLKKKDWQRSSYIITTKIYWGKGETDARGLSRKYIVESLKKSLERLQLDYVDIVFLHRVDNMCPMEEIVRAMTHCINKGWAMYWGTSRWSSVEIMESYTNCRQFNCITPICEQSEYHMFCRDKVELYVPELYNKIGVGCMAWSPLAMGLITSKTDDEVPIFTRPSFRKKYSNLTWNEDDRDCVNKETKENKEGYTLLGDRLPTDESHRQRIKLREISMIAERLGCTPTQLSIAWGVKNEHVQCQLVGAPSMEQLYENIQSLQVVPKLNSHVMNELERLLDNKPIRPPIISTLQQR